LQLPNFLLTDFKKLLEDVFYNMHLHMWFLHNSAPPYYSCKVKKLPWMLISHGHEALVSWPASSPNLSHLNFSFSVGIFGNQGLCQRSILERNCGIKFNNCKWNTRYTQNLPTLASFFFMQSWIAYSWNTKAISSTASMKVKIKGLLITLFSSYIQPIIFGHI
jgi:hypothetical protein